MSTLARFAPQLHFVPPSSTAQNALSSSKIGAVQSYSTIHGNALTVRFQHQQQNSSSHLVPLSNPLSLASCEASVLEMWFSEMVKPRFGMHKQDYGIPLDAVKQKIGLINTCYHSTSPFLDSKRTLPFAGSAEFSLLPHREELSFSVTLWDEVKRPLSTTTWTGPKGKFGGGPVGIQISNEEVEREMKKMKRIPLQEYNSNQNGEGFENSSSNVNDENSNSVLSTSSSSDLSAMSSNNSAFSELFLPVIPRASSGSLKKTKNGGYSILVMPNKDHSSSFSSPLMTIPIHDTCLCEFAAQVWKTAIQPNLMKMMKDKNSNKEEDSSWEQEFEEGASSSEMTFCRMVSKTATFGAVNQFEPFELRSSPPLFSSKLMTKPWEHKTGLPNLRGEPCLGLRIETIQDGEVRGVGTYYFTSW